MDKFELLELALRGANPSWLGPLEVLPGEVPPEFRGLMPQMAELTLLGSVVQWTHPDYEVVWLAGMTPPVLQPAFEAKVFCGTKLEPAPMLERFEFALKTLGWEPIYHQTTPLLSGFVHSGVLEWHAAEAENSQRQVEYWNFPAHSSTLRLDVNCEKVTLTLQTGPLIEPRPEHFPQAEMLCLPLLEPPPGMQVKQILGGGMSSSGDTAYSHTGALLEGEISAEEVFISMRAQLERAGWNLVSGGENVYSSQWTFLDASGEGKALLLISQWSPGVWHIHLQAITKRDGARGATSSAQSWFP